MRTGLLAPDCAATKKRVTKEAAGTIVRELSLRRAPLARSTTSLFAPSQKLTRPDSLLGKPLLWKIHLPFLPQAGASPPCRDSVRRTVNRTSRPTGTARILAFRFQGHRNSAPGATSNALIAVARLSLIKSLFCICVGKRYPPGGRTCAN